MEVDIAHESALAGNGDLLAQSMHQAFKDVNENEARASQVDVREEDCPNEASGKADA